MIHFGNLVLFLLIAGVANMTPIFVSRFPFLKNLSYPLDFHQTINGKRIFGDHKTIRGFVCGIIFGTLTSFILNAFLNSNSVNPVLLGFLLSFGALIGDAIKSFFKRQMNIKSGVSWFPFDQIDYILGAIAMSYFYFRLSIGEYVVLLLLGVGLHVLISFVGYLLKFKEKPI